MRRRLLALACAPALVAAAAFGAVRHDGTAHPAADPAPSSFPLAPIAVDGLQLPARVEGERFAIASDGRFRPRFLPGVNLGSTVPGRMPGEVSAIDRAQYADWIRQAVAVGARVVRVYTILPPAFYDALAAYDQAHPRAPLGLVQGVWIPEERFLKVQDAYDPQVTQGFQHEIDDAVNVVHGRADLPVRRGHASGGYHADVSRWLLAWSLGIEWDPQASGKTIARHPHQPPFHGRYIRATANANAMESWLASMLDRAAGDEVRYGWSRPLTFTNWVTTDPLRHPSEAMHSEDAVSIDAMHVQATSAWPAGVFASYHVYPYYPDSVRSQPSYLSFRGPDGRRDPYAGYLHALRVHHKGQAVMITEFGVPSSLGEAHTAPLGRDQGNHSELGAGRVDAQLLRDIRAEGLAGGFVFELTDEWFKFTWNTYDLEQPTGRRQLWRNDLTNEEHFGLLAEDPGTHDTAVLDGRDDEWKNGQSQVVAEAKHDAIREIRVAHDAESLWLRLRLDHSGSWRSHPLQLGLDTRPGGNGGLPGSGLDPAADVSITIGPGNQARLEWAQSADPISWTYGLGTYRSDPHVVHVDPTALLQASGAWVPARLVLDKPSLPHGSRPAVKLHLFDVSHLRWGSGDPSDARSDVRNTIDGNGHVLELRLPWALLTYSDPSSHQVWLPHLDGTVTSETAGRVGIVAAADGDTLAGSYGWDPWNRVTWHERRKAGFPIVSAALRRAFQPYR